jgi:hypothetical protein
MSFTQTQVFDDACLVGGVAALIDDSVNPAYAVLYEGATPLVTLVFAQPAVALVAHALAFEQADPTGDLIPVQGDADNFELYNGDAVLLGTGDVTDSAGSGALKISGTTGTRLYLGARAILDELTIG